MLHKGDSVATVVHNGNTTLRLISRIAVAVLITLVALFFLARLRYPGKPPMKLPPDACDAGLWNHVYEKDRLLMIEPCTAVEGRVASIHNNKDGDLHIELDVQDKSVLNVFNIVPGRGRLVTEVICEHTPATAVEKTACGEYRSQVAIPHQGDRVRVTGSYVTDGALRWNEIHPVTRIEILR